jgi:SNF2 family DNA or RNA helicase
MSKAIYIPTNENTFVLNKNDTHCEILLHGDYKTVPICDIKFADQGTKLSTLQEFKDNVFVSLVQKPVDGIFYSHNANRFTPEPHQYKPLLKILNSENNRILIADEVGLGKTIEAGMIYQEISKRERIGISLIVVPTSLTLKWRDELKIRFNEDFQIKKVNEFIYFINDYDRYYDSKLYNDKLIISYHTLRNDKVVRALKKSIVNFDFLIMDEAHSMRNGGGNTFLAGQIIANKSKNIILLSATPVQNKLVDLFNILSLLDNQYFKDFDFFEQKIAPNRIIHRLISDLRNTKPLAEIQQVVIESLDGCVENELREIYNDLLKLSVLDTASRIQFSYLYFD